jgi:hypothetical protein
MPNHAKPYQTSPNHVGGNGNDSFKMFSLQRSYFSLEVGSKLAKTEFNIYTGKFKLGT